MVEKQRNSPSNGSIVGGGAATAAPPARSAMLGWKRRYQMVGLLFLLPAVIFVAVFYVYPILLNVMMSFSKYTARSFVTGEAPFIGFGNFNRLLSNPNFIVALQNTILFTLGSLTFQFTIGLALAVFFNQKIPLRSLLRSLFLLPWLAPILVSGAIWVRLFDLDYGVINYVLRSLGVIKEPLAWLIDPHLAPISVLIANIWIGIPFNMVILYGGLQNIPNALYEAAMIDGASAWQKFRFVTWPLLRPVSTVVLLLGLIYTLRVFDVIMSITRGGPANVSHTLNTWAYSLSFTSLDFGLGAAAGDILMLIVLVFGLLYLRYAAREER
jgi:multiple sugar transport system permease protein